MKNTIIVANKIIYNNTLTNPLTLFIVTIVGTWLFYILTSDVSYKFDRNYYLLTLVVSSSVLFFSTSYIFISFKYKFKTDSCIPIDINNIKISKVINILFIVILFILILNLFVDGLPPILSSIADNIKSYHEYGKFKAFLTPALNILVLLTFLQPYKYKKIYIFVFAITVNIVYLMRGPLIVLIIQSVFLNICLNKPDKIKSLYKILPLFPIIIILMAILGEIRTGSEIFYFSMGIKDEYKYINIGFLWFITYIDASVSDLLTIIGNIDIIPKHYGLYLIFNSLPSFARPELSVTNMVNFDLIDGTLTYLGNILFDFGLVGIVFINLIYGALLSILYHSKKYRENILIKPIYLGIVLLICFWDYVFYIHTIIQFVLSIIIFKYISIKRTKSVIVG